MTSESLVTAIWATPGWVGFHPPGNEPVGLEGDGVTRPLGAVAPCSHHVGVGRVRGPVRWTINTSLDGRKEPAGTSEHWRTSMRGRGTLVLDQRLRGIEDGPHD